MTEPTAVTISTFGGPGMPISVSLERPQSGEGEGLTLIGSLLGPQTGSVKAAIAGALERYPWPALASGKIGRPCIRSFALDDAATAHTATEAEGPYDKVVFVTPCGVSSQ